MTFRCVDIERQGSPSAKEAKEYLFYDCDVGIYHNSGNGVAQATSGSTYSLDICLDKACQSFLLRLPEEQQESANGLILVESKPLREDGHLILHFPPGFDPGKSLKMRRNVDIFLTYETTNNRKFSYSFTKPLKITLH